MLISLRPTVIPGVLRSTMNAVNALPALSSGPPVRASTKYLHSRQDSRTPQHISQSKEDVAGYTVKTHQLAMPPFVIHIFEPLMTHSSPFLTARVCTPATSLPAPGSVTQYAACSGSAVRRPRYSFFCSVLPAKMTGAEARPFASIAVLMPVQPYCISQAASGDLHHPQKHSACSEGCPGHLTLLTASSSATMTSSNACSPAPPNSVGMARLTRPLSQACALHGVMKRAGAYEHKHAPDPRHTKMPDLVENLLGVLHCAIIMRCFGNHLCFCKVSGHLLKCFPVAQRFSSTFKHNAS
jgi:hypothetical protein